MARSSKRRKSNSRPKGPSLDSEAKKKTRSMEELLGVAAMELESNLRSPEEDIMELKQSQQTHRMFSEWLTSIHSLAGNQESRKINWV